MSDLFDETESDESDDDVTVAGYLIG